MFAFLLEAALSFLASVLVPLPFPARSYPFLKSPTTCRLSSYNKKQSKVLSFITKSNLRIAFWRRGSLGQSLAPVILVVFPLRNVLQILHVSDQHRAQLDKVAVFRIFDFHNSPWVQPTPNLRFLAVKHL